MLCDRCGQEIVIGVGRRPDRDPLQIGSRNLCGPCDAAYDDWSRQHATDIVWEALAGMVVVMGFGVGLPLLGASVLISALGAICGFGTIFGAHHLNMRRRKRQFLTTTMPRAYLPGKT